MRYEALALQLTTVPVGDCHDRKAARAAIMLNIERVARTLEASRAWLQLETGTPLGLAVLPEYALTGAPSTADFARWRELAAFEMDGPEYLALGQIASANGLFLAGNAYEADPHFPSLYFQCSFIMGPAGETALRYRRLISLYSPSPYDVWERYLELYGHEAVFPVADTPIGRLAAIASEEILYPEIARCHAVRGAEIFVHSTSEMGSPRSTPKELARRARAAENLACLVSANAAGVTNTALPERSSTGMSKIIDYDGRVLAAAAPGGDSLAAHATLDLAALRDRRRRSGLSNVLVRQPLQAYAAAYRDTVFRPAGLLAARTEAASRDTLNGIQRETIRRLIERKLF